MNSYEDQVSAVRDVLQAKHDRYGFDSLSDAEKALWVTEELVAEVCNGGFHQYFFNSSGNHASLLIDALDKVGAFEILQLCRSAIDLAFDGRPADDRFERQNQLEKTESRMGGNNLEDELYKLDQEFYPLLTDLYRRLHDFVVRNALLPSLRSEQ